MPPKRWIDPTEREKILIAAQKGDQKALEALLTVHRDAVFRYGLRYCKTTEDAEDAVQETLGRPLGLLQAFGRPLRLRPGCSPSCVTRATGYGTSSAAAWISPKCCHLCKIPPNRRRSRSQRDRPSKCSHVRFHALSRLNGTLFCCAMCEVSRRRKPPIFWESPFKR